MKQLNHEQRRKTGELQEKSRRLEKLLGKQLYEDQRHWPNNRRNWSQRLLESRLEKLNRQIVRQDRQVMLANQQQQDVQQVDGNYIC